MTQAVVLAGGRGTRLAPLTDTLPKPMAPVHGRPFLWHLLRLLAAGGVADVVLCIGYRGGQIREYFADGRALGLRLAYSDDGGRPLGTGGALKAAEPLLDRRFLLLYGDTYWPIHFAGLLRRTEEPGVLAAMGVRPATRSGGAPPNVALLSGRVRTYDKTGATPGLTHVEAGVDGLFRAALALLPPDGPCSLEADLFPAMAAQGRLAAWSSRTAFYDIGTPDRLRRFERFVAGPSRHRAPETQDPPPRNGRTPGTAGTREKEP